MSRLTIEQRAYLLGKAAEWRDLRDRQTNTANWLIREYERIAAQRSLGDADREWIASRFGTINWSEAVRLGFAPGKVEPRPAARAAFAVPVHTNRPGNVIPFPRA